MAFLTVFRIRMEPPPVMEDLGKAAWAFPLVGVVIGLILVLARFTLAGPLPTLLAAVIIVGLWVVLTGGLHLDGWCDCCDALASPVDAERRFEILKDSRLGTFGALGLILLITAKTAAIADDRLPLTMLFLAPVISRGVMVLAAHGAGHRGEGMAAQFISGLDPRTVRWAAILGLAPAVIGGWPGIIAAAAAYAVAILFRRGAESRLGAVNGDVIGAWCELAEVIVLIVGCMTW
jgi:adenosylcobinamide-GDP ribazoletransferase